MSGWVGGGYLARSTTTSRVEGWEKTCRASSTRDCWVWVFSAASRRKVWALERTSGSVERWVGGWVGGWVEESEVVRMRCCTSHMGAWVGGLVGER